LDWLANFVLIEVFPVRQNAISLGGVMVCFAALSITAVHPDDVRSSPAGHTH
jgi:hypothetical protein